MSNFQQADHPILILIRGLPGSGKTYIAQVLQNTLGHDKVVMLDPDTIDYGSKAYKDHVAAQTAEGVDPLIHPFRFSKFKAFDGISAGKVIIWNQPFTNSGMFTRLVESLQAYAAEHDVKLGTLVVEVETDPAVAKARIEQRKQEGGHGPSDNTFARFVSDYVSLPSDNYTSVLVDGGDDASVSAASILRALETLARS